ncbi:hypothetical protein [Photorhabdus akhurstii]|nr:hypothetical protein [Photorhabdus akhurstii]
MKLNRLKGVLITRYKEHHLYCMGLSTAGIHLHSGGGSFANIASSSEILA